MSDLTPVQEARVLTVRQPWAWAIIHGGKSVENRSRNIAGAYRGPVAIHAARSFGAMSEYAEATHTVRRLTGGLMGEEVPGAIIGVVDLVSVHSSEDGGLDVLRRDPQGEIAEFTGCSPWADPNVYHLVLANPRPLSEPIPYKGALGLRRLPAEVVAAINADLGTVQA